MDIQRMQQNADEAAELLKLLANPTRLMVLCALVTREHTAGELEELARLSQPAMSQHLARLRHHELVDTRKDGARVYYSLKHPGVKQIVSTMHGIYCPNI